MTPLLWLIAGCWLDQTTVDDKLVWDDPAVLDTDTTETDAGETDPPVDDTDPPDTDPPVDDTDPPVDTDLPLPTCADVRRPGPAPWIAAGTTVGDDDDWTPSCAGGAPAPDRVYAWRAPEAGCYRFTTEGSLYDTVLAVAADCDNELLCSDDLGVSLQSEIHWPLEAGEDILIAVDGYGGEDSSGAYSLTVERGDLIPPDLDLGSAVGAVADGTTFGQDTTLDASACLGISSGKDFLIRWTAPRSEYYYFTVASPLVDLTLSAFHECGGLPYECVDDAGALFDDEVLELPMEQGETIILRIAGVYRAALGGFDTGAWDLTITTP